MTEFQNSFVMHWAIQNFSCCVQPTGQCLVSARYKEEPSNKQEWFFKVFPKGINNNAVITFALCSNMAVDGIFNYTMSVIDKYGSLHFSKEVKSVRFLSQPSFSVGKSFQRDDLLAKKVLLLPEDTLTLQCIVKRPLKQHSIMEFIKRERSSFTWPIGDFSSITKESNSYTYPLIVSFEKAPKLNLACGLEGDGENATVGVKFVKLNQYEERYDDSTKIRKKYFFECNIIISFEISLIDAQGTMKQLLKGEQIFLQKNDETSDYFKLIKKNDLLKAKSEVLPNDILTLAFILRISDGSKLTLTNATKTFFPATKPNTSVFCNSLCEKLYKDRNLCDVVLKVGNEKLSAHKAVLHSQSPVFQAMLDSDMVEKHSGVINIDDFDAGTMELLLELLYTGKVDENLSSEKILSLYAAAHKYQVPNFQDVLCPLLTSKITRENVWEVIAFAGKYEDAVLKDASESFVSEHLSKSLDEYRNDEKTFKFLD